MTVTALRRLTKYNRVLLALYWLADDEGLICAATNAGIARAAGVSAATVGNCLRNLESEGTVAVYADKGLPCRVIVLLDHPEAATLVRKAEKARRCAIGPDRSFKLYTTFHGRLVKVLA